MSSVTEGWRIGAIPFLNARPLLPANDKVQLELHSPATISDFFRKGKFDAALIPTVEAMASDAPVVDGVAIACEGEVFSVYLAFRGRIEECSSVWLDPASRTSVALLQCILAERYGLRPKLHSSGAPSPEEARLLIGDAAIRFREIAREGWQFLDLGHCWWELTRLPFVFAVWQLRPGFSPMRDLADTIRGWKAAGLAKRDEISAAHADPDFCRRYLGEWIRYELGDREKLAVTRFAELLRHHQIVPERNLRPWQFV